MLDIEFVVRQSVVACNGSDAILQPAIADFTTWLNSVNADPSAHPVEQLASCIDGAIVRVESSLAGMNNPQAFIPRASHVTSQVMRLLVSHPSTKPNNQTLRSDMSFGWFQLLKTWIDDYVGISCTRRSAFTRDEVMQQQPQTVQLLSAPPTLAIDTSAQYHTISQDQNAITPRPFAVPVTTLAGVAGDGSFM